MVLGAKDVQRQVEQSRERWTTIKDQTIFMTSNPHQKKKHAELHKRKLKESTDGREGILVRFKNERKGKLRN